jgi:hypothetical protein
MSFPLNPVQSQTTIQNGIKYVYSTSTNSWRRVYDNLIDRLTIAGNFTSTNTATGALIVYSGVGIGGDLNVGGKVVVWDTSTSLGLTDLNSLYVKGGIGIDQDLLVGGDALFLGQTTFVGTVTYLLSTQTVYTDSVIVLHDPENTTTWSLNDGRDIGIVMHYYDVEDSYAFLGRDNSTGYLEWLSNNVSRDDIDYSGTYGTMRLGSIILTDTTASSDTATGALRVEGGVGIGGDLFVGGIINGDLTGTAQTATNIANGAAGSIPYQISQGLTGFIDIGSSGTVLTSDGSTASWQNISVSIIDDDFTDDELYPLFVNTTTGILTTGYTTQNKLSWNPNLGLLTVVDLNTTSDIREKTNLSKIANALSILNQIDGYSFTWKDSQRDSYGVVAQYLEEILPELVGENDQGMKNVRYLPLIAILIEGVKDLSSQLEKIQNQLNTK